MMLVTSDTKEMLLSFYRRRVRTVKKHKTHYTKCIFLFIQIIICSSECNHTREGPRAQEEVGQYSRSKLNIVVSVSTLGKNYSVSKSSIMQISLDVSIYIKLFVKVTLGLDMVKINKI